jgi:hypothetical protein
MDPTLKQPPRHGGIELDEPMSRVVVYDSDVCSWSTPNKSWSSEVLLEELSVILSIQHTTQTLMLYVFLPLQYSSV